MLLFHFLFFPTRKEAKKKMFEILCSRLWWKDNAIIVDLLSFSRMHILSPRAFCCWPSQNPLENAGKKNTEYQWKHKIWWENRCATDCKNCRIMVPSMRKNRIKMVYVDLIKRKPLIMSLFAAFMSICSFFFRRIWIIMACCEDFYWFRIFFPKTQFYARNPREENGRKRYFFQ